MSYVYRFEKALSEDELNSLKMEHNYAIGLEIKMMTNEIKEQDPDAVITDICHKVTDDFGIPGRHHLITITIRSDR